MFDLFLLFSHNYVASRGKEAPKAKGGAPAALALDYTDIPHSQIRKVILEVIILLILCHN